MKDEPTKKTPEEHAEMINASGIELAEQIFFYAASTGQPEQRHNQLQIVEVAALHVLASMAMNHVTWGRAETVEDCLKQWTVDIANVAETLIEAHETGQTHLVDFNEEQGAELQ